MEPRLYVRRYAFFGLAVGTWWYIYIAVVQLQ